MTRGPSTGRANRAGASFLHHPEKASERRTGHQNVPFIAATQSPPPVYPTASAQRGGYQAGDRMSPEVSPVPRPGRPDEAYGYVAPENAQDVLIHRDRHGYLMKGTERTGRRSGMCDPLESGPPRADFRVVNFTWNLQAGFGQRNQDNLARPYTWLGQQDGTWVPVYGGQPGFYRNGPGGAPSTTSGRGPSRVFSGPPHGLHTESPPDYAQTLARSLAVPQMQAARVDRLSNSRSGGQSYSQTTMYQGMGRM